VRITLVVAVSRNGVIGAEGGIPWRLPDDQKFFKQITMGHTLVMGRATWDSIGRPLPGRTTLVVSRNRALETAGARVMHGVDDALETARAAGEDECFVVGGAAIYEAALGHSERIWLTRIEADIPGDVIFPDFRDGRFGSWKLVDETPHPADERHAHSFRIQCWERETPVG
jgi:dihydrofolate reductase